MSRKQKTQYIYVAECKTRPGMYLCDSANINADDLNPHQMLKQYNDFTHYVLTSNVNHALKFPNKFLAYMNTPFGFNSEFKFKKIPTQKINEVIVRWTKK